MMKILNKTLILTASALVFSLSVSAHDPSMHKKKAEKADCTTFNEMQESGKKMDMNDPIMMAMMKKCKTHKAESESKCGDMSDGHHDKKAEKGDKKCGDMKAEKGDKKCGDMKAEKGDKKCGDMKKPNSKTEEQNDHDH